jgi:hypothetical protein
MTTKSETEQFKLKPISKTFSANQKSLQNCYESFFSNESSPSITLFIDFDIARKGKVEAVTFGEESTETKEEFLNCITSSIKSWSFPEYPENGASVSRFPLIFNSKNL